MKSQFIVISRSLINFAEDADDYLWHGIFLASAYFLFGVVHTFQDTHSDHVGHMLGIKIRTSVCGAIYRKVQQQVTILSQSISNFPFFFIFIHPFLS